MNRGRISTQVFLCFLIMMFLVVSGCSKSDDAPAPSPTYTVTFDSQSATVAASPTSKTVTSPATTVVTLPTPPTKTNYYFAGWWTTATSGGTEFIASTTVTASITVYARWSTSPVYTVTYDSQGGSAVGAQHVTSPATTVGILPAAPTKTGYLFNSWNTQADGLGATFTAGTSGTTVTGNITVYAQWDSYDYTVTYNSDGGSAVTAQHVISPETTVVTLPTPPTKASSTFAGWFTAASGGGTHFTGSTTVAASLTVYANWTTNPVYTVTYDSQGGTAVGAQQVTLPATTVGTLPAAPTRTGYTFNGWNTLATGLGTPFIGSTTVAANITVYAKWTAIPGPFTQDDLTGTWRMNLLKTGTDTEWDRARITINSSGVATCLSVDASFSGGNVCPNPFDLKLTMNTSTGVITESGNHAVGGGGHMTMTSNKNFVVGTGTNGTTPNFSYQLAIAQKEVSGTSYIATDVQSKSFVYHMLQVGATNKWQYGTGSTDTAGGVNITSETDPSGTVVPGAQGTLSVDGNGVVTMSPDMGTYQGFLSADKKTIVGTFTEEGTKYRLMIIQITGQTYTAGPLPAGISAQHMLVVGVTPAPLWFHFTSTVASGGVITLSDWVSSNSGITNPGTTQHGSISASGTLTITEEPTFHGQVSDDGKFTVATQTVGTGDYSLHVSTK